MSRRASVQATRLSLEAIEDGVVTFPGPQYRAVLEVRGVNFALAGPVEQEALLAGYAALLNGLTFPLQILIRVLPVDVEGYLADLERRSRQQLGGELATLARDHIAFLRRLARNRNLLERHFYLVVPAEGEVAITGRVPLLPRRRSRGPDLAAARKQLTFRCEEVERQLMRCGLAVQRLGDSALAQLYYACWCPELARLQRLRQELDEYTTLVVQAHSTPERRP